MENGDDGLSKRVMVSFVLVLAAVFLSGHIILPHNAVVVALEV
jgi:hypothetical protein